MLPQTGPPVIIPSGTIMALNLFLAIVGGYLVYRDAKRRRTDTPILWGLAVGAASIALSFVGTLLALVAYYLRVVDT